MGMDQREIDTLLDHLFTIDESLTRVVQVLEKLERLAEQEANNVEKDDE